MKKVRKTLMTMAASLAATGATVGVAASCDKSTANEIAHSNYMPSTDRFYLSGVNTELFQTITDRITHFAENSKKESVTNTLRDLRFIQLNKENLTRLSEDDLFRDNELMKFTFNMTAINKATDANVSGFSLITPRDLTMTELLGTSKSIIITDDEATAKNANPKNLKDLEQSLSNYILEMIYKFKTMQDGKHGNQNEFLYELVVTDMDTNTYTLKVWPAKFLRNEKGQIIHTNTQVKTTQEIVDELEGLKLNPYPLFALDSTATFPNSDPEYVYPTPGSMILDYALSDRNLLNGHHWEERYGLDTSTAHIFARENWVEDWNGKKDQDIWKPLTNLKNANSRSEWTVRRTVKMNPEVPGQVIMTIYIWDILEYPDTTDLSHAVKVVKVFDNAMFDLSKGKFRATDAELEDIALSMQSYLPRMHGTDELFKDSVVLSLLRTKLGQDAKDTLINGFKTFKKQLENKDELMKLLRAANNRPDISVKHIMFFLRQLLDSLVYKDENDLTSPIDFSKTYSKFLNPPKGTVMAWDLNNDYAYDKVDENGDFVISYLSFTSTIDLLNVSLSLK